MKKLYSNKLDNLEEIDQFLEIYSLPRQNHEEKENQNRPITSKVIESAVINISASKSPASDSLVNSTKHSEKF